MTPLQYDRWKDFAMRMARTCFIGQRRPSPEWILENVTEFFDCFFASSKKAAKVKDWDSDPDYVCDRMSDFACEHDERIGYSRIRRDDEDRVDRYRNRLKRQGLDYEAIEKMADELEGKLEDTIDDRENVAFDQWENQWIGSVSCCVRAGLDVACEPSAGVVGFTVGDLHAMYPEGIPDWIHDAYEGKLRDAADGEGVWL